ncbi:hypothetical protein FOZ61_006162 [Perkinsus olseni]|uniref:Uncharacterized protein n=1 Tax=Perkinsus olseni TaxID=32597 RepID=A0A7J6LEC1_PEROL|nr:hypothetical protein FOZ61_006162 [Perkinsus olseni]
MRVSAAGFLYAVFLPNLPHTEAIRTGARAGPLDGYPPLDGSTQFDASAREAECYSGDYFNRREPDSQGHLIFTVDEKGLHSGTIGCPADDERHLPAFQAKWHGGEGIHDYRRNYDGPLEESNFFFGFQSSLGLDPLKKIDVTRISEGMKDLRSAALSAVRPSAPRIKNSGFHGYDRYLYTKQRFDVRDGTVTKRKMALD